MQRSKVLHRFPPQALQSSNFCKRCMYGKQSCLWFPKVVLRTQIFLELVHSNLCGPVRGNWFGGIYYFITCIDNYNRYSTVYLLRQKLKTISYYKEYKALVEN